MGLSLGRRVEICYAPCLFPSRSYYYQPPVFLGGKTERDGQHREQFVQSFQENWQHSNCISIQNCGAGDDLSLRTELIAERESKFGHFQVDNTVNSELCGRIVHLCGSLYWPPSDIK